MTTDELASEKRIADDCPVLDDPPVPSPETLAWPDLVPADDPPSTVLLLEGVPRGSITASFLADVMDAAEDHDLAVEGISVLDGEQDER